MGNISVQTVESEDGNENEKREDEERTPAVLATAAVCAVVVGAIAAYAASNLNTVAMAGAFVLAASGSGYYLSQKEPPAAVAGAASYISAVVLVFTPFALYLPDIVIRDEEVRLFAQDVEASDVTIGGDALFEAGGFGAGSVAQGNVDGVIQLIAWFVIFSVAAVLLLVVGKVLKTAAEKQES